MKVGNSHYPIRHVEQTYRQTRPGLKHADQIQKAGQKIASVNAKVSRTQPLRPQDILTAKEIATLRALFDDQFNSASFYGNNRVRNIQSGFLLDIRG